MLYIWPYIFFFSWQQIIPRVRALISPPQYLPRVFQIFRPQNPKQAFPRILTLTAFTLLGLVAVHYNTIVHPFTLADNRHYVFYVFRILLRHPLLKYLAVPAYIFCGWAALLALGLPPQQLSAEHASQRDIVEKQVSSGGSRSTALFDPQRGCKTSYVLIWIVSTTLCLITAPLVEPRYVIIPWILWRYGVASVPSEHVQSPAVIITRGSQAPELSNTLATRLRILGQPLNHGEHRLYVETLWFVLVNAVTCYVFLYRGFAWPQEPEAVQRFMW